MFEIKPYEEVLQLTEEALDSAMLPVRARAAKAKADLKRAEIDESMISLESRIHEMCAKRDINFDAVIDKIDEYELLDRKHDQVQELVSKLFPET